MFCPVSAVARPLHQYPWTPSMIFIRSHCHSDVAMGCAWCAMHKGPQPSEGPHQYKGPSAILKGPLQSRGLHQSERAPAIWDAPEISRGSSNLRGSQQSEGFRKSEGPYQREGPPTIWRGPINLRGRQQSEAPPAICLFGSKIFKYCKILFIHGVQGGSWGPPLKLCTRASKNLAMSLHCHYQV